MSLLDHNYEQRARSPFHNKYTYTFLWALAQSNAPELMLTYLI